jgi:ketosteroid isomerase-like protein
MSAQAGCRTTNGESRPQNQSQVQTMGAAENKQFISNMFAELSKGNSEAFLGALADDVRFTIIGSTKYSGTFKGKQDLIARLLAPLAAQVEGGMTITPDNLIADGDFVAMQAHGKALSKNGTRYDNTYCHVFRIANGKVLEVTEYLDTELITSAFGK